MKALASDFDGTIFFENEMSGFRENDLISIRKFQKEGHLFGICTGRPISGIITHVQDKIDFDFYIVTSGALILDKNLQIIDEQSINQEIIKGIISTYKDKIHISIQASQCVYTLEQTNTDIAIPQTVIQSVDEVEGQIYGLSINAYSEENARKLCLEINENIQEVEAFQNKQYIDIVKRGCSKGNAVLRLKEKFQIDYIAGIGDSYNDISMLESADCAFTFVDSPKIVQDKADQLVHSVSEAIDLLESVSLSEKKKLNIL